MKDQILKEYSRFALKDFYEEQGWNTTPSLDWLEKRLDKYADDKVAEKMKNVRLLMKREYMRGQIDRSNGKYTLESLERRYTKYLKDNPDVFSTLDNEAP